MLGAKELFSMVLDVVYEVQPLKYKVDSTYNLK